MLYGNEQVQSVASVFACFYLAERFGHMVLGKTGKGSSHPHAVTAAACPDSCGKAQILEEGISLALHPHPCARHELQLPPAVAPASNALPGHRRGNHFSPQASPRPGLLFVTTSHLCSKWEVWLGVLD